MFIDVLLYLYQSSDVHVPYDINLHLLMSTLVGKVGKVSQKNPSVSQGVYMANMVMFMC